MNRFEILSKDRQVKLMLNIIIDFPDMNRNNMTISENWERSQTEAIRPIIEHSGAQTGRVKCLDSEPLEKDNFWTTGQIANFHLKRRG